MELITTDFQQSIKIGELEAFKKTVDSMIEVTARNEPDTLSYNWFINEEGTECHLLETFKDSEGCCQTNDFKHQIDGAIEIYALNN